MNNPFSRAFSQQSQRRQLLASATGLALSSLALGRSQAADGPAAAQKAGKATAFAGLNIGLASYSMRKKSLDEVIALCKDLGIRHITVKDMHLPRTDAPEKLKADVKKIQDAGIIITGGGVINWKPDAKKNETVKDATFEAQMRKDFEYAKICGFPMIVCSPVSEALDLVEKMVKEFDLPVAIHNHGPEDKIWPTPLDVFKLIKSRDKRLGICMDIGHTVRAGGDPAKTALVCGPRLVDLHIKDLRKDGEKWTQLSVGRGQFDIPALFRALLKLKYSGHVALEYEINIDDPVPGIRDSIGYLRGVAAALGALPRA